jgi:transmembrane sensor
MKSNREILLRRYLDKTATPEEVQELLKILVEEGYRHEDELLRQLEIDLRTHEEYSEEDKAHVANDLIYEWEKEKEKATVPIYGSAKYIWWSAAATIVIALSVGLYIQLFRDSNMHVASTEIIPAILISIKGPELVILPDSSTVILNAGSELSYSKTFGQELREVFLMGEAFFDIKHDPSHKFVVRSGGVSTTVMGTAFNVRQLPFEVVITVARGKVAVKEGVQEFGTITPNEQFTVNTESHICTKSKVKEGHATEWASNFIVIKNETFEHAVEQIETKFNVKIVVENPAILKCRVTIGLLNKPKLEEALTVLTTLVNATWTMKDSSSVTIRGGKCK